MLNYIRADYRRIAARRPRVVLVALFQIVFAALLIIPWVNNPETWNSVRYVEKIASPLNTFFPLFVGLVNFINTFSYDFKAKTMQVAIGLGVSREKVVASKLIQFALVTLTDLLFTAVLAVVLAIVSGAGVTTEHTLKIMVDFLGAWIFCIGYGSISMIIVFQMQGTNIAMLLYLFFCSTLPYFLLRMLTRFGPEIFGRLHLEKLTLDYSLEIFRSYLTMGKFNLSAVLGIIIYIGLGLLCSALIFRKRELDF